MAERLQALIMFSGGKDSLLTVCKTIEYGCDIHLVTFDNKRTSWLDVTKETAELLKTKYKNHPIDHKIISTYDIIENLTVYYKDSTLHQISSQYPLLKPYQINCLHCHTAMYVKSIILCKKNNYQIIANGARFNQGFIVEHLNMLFEYINIAKKYDIQTYYPVLSYNDEQRKMDLADRNIMNDVLEPQCWVGCPCKEGLNDEEIQMYIKYFKEQLQEKMIEYIDANI